MNLLLFPSSFQRRSITDDNIRYRLASSISNNFDDRKMSLYYVQSKITQTFSIAKNPYEGVLIEFCLFSIKSSVISKYVW